MDEIAALRALSPLDGRYAAQLTGLGNYFSEYGLFKYRLHVEVEYLLELADVGLAQMPALSENIRQSLRKSVVDFSPEDALKIKAFEQVTNHDIKALEYYIHNQLDHLQATNVKPWVHFGLTSQDINNAAVPLSIKDFCHSEYLPLLQQFIVELRARSTAWMDVPMLAHTHGQSASPTRLGKEIAVFVERLESQQRKLSTTVFSGKFGGATGGFNAHAIAYPTINWPAFADRFLNRLGLQRQQITTQIEHYDGLAELFDNLARVNTIILDFCRDMWLYISFAYFKLEVKKGEVGSSAMPHKVNPIDFENAEGNVGLSNAILQHLATKLPVSRLQRDLSDSTVLRSLGVPMGHAMLALKGALRGLQKCTPNFRQIAQDLDDNAVVIAEAYQVILRREGVSDGYEIMKALTRNNEQPTLGNIQAIIPDLPVSDAVKEELRLITPHSYIGVLPETLGSQLR